MDKVLILDANQRAALAATRSLGSRGLHVAVADETPKTLAGSSKYHKDTFVYPSPYQFPKGFVTALKRECAERGIKVIFPMTELTTHLVLKERDEFKEFSIPFCSFDAFDRLTDKWKLCELARQLGVPTPATHFVSGLEDLRAISPQLTYPAVLKPYRSRIWSEGRWIAASVQYACSIQEAERIVARNECFNRHPFLVQEFVRGQAHGVSALYDHSKPVALFAHRRLREKPPSGGVSVLSESVEVNSRLGEMARRILDEVKWHGVAMVEFKVSSDGTPYLMEVNARFWGSVQLAIDAGVDFPWLLYQLAIGKTPDRTADYRAGIRNRWLLGDLAHLYRVCMGNGKDMIPAPVEKWQSVLRFLNFFEGNTHYEVNRWDDLGPFLFEVKRCLRR